MEKESEFIKELQNKLNGYNFLQELESEIVSNIRVLIKDKRGKTLWTCNDGEWRDDLFKDMELEVEQVLPMGYILSRIIKMLETKIK